jgi:predicted membrane protein
MRDRDYFRYRDSSQFSEERLKRFREERQRNRMFFGMGIAVVGVLLLLRSMEILPHFSFSYSWPYVLIIIGILMGIKRGGRSSAWWILILIGAANLIPQFTIMGKPSSQIVWPVLVILAGLAFAFRPSRNRCVPGQRRGRYMDTNINTESTLNIDVTFGGKKEVVTSKDFKGGVISTTFGGCEINLTQADFTEPSAILECHVSFGSVEIILPSHWEVQNEVSPSFGSVEDARTMQTATTSENKKLLILRGNCSFGSIELKSY